MERKTGQTCRTVLARLESGHQGVRLRSEMGDKPQGLAG